MGFKDTIDRIRGERPLELDDPSDYGEDCLSCRVVGMYFDVPPTHRIDAVQVLQL